MNNKIPGYIVRNGVAVGLNADIVPISTAPIGTVLSFAGSTAPYGFLICNGQAVSRTEYADLFKVIGTTYGEGDGSTTFNIPDYRETVLVGVGENTTDTIADHDIYELGEFKDDQLQGHWHNLGSSDGVVTVSLGAGDKGGSINSAAPEVNVKRYPITTALDAITDGTNGEPRKGTTTHSKQKGVTYIIKAMHINEGMDKIENPIRTTLDIALAENDCDNISNIISDETTVISTVSSDIVAHTPKDTFATETGFFEITTTRQNSTYAWQTAKRLGGKPNVFQRCMLDGVWEQWRSVGVVRDDLMNDINTWSSSKIASEIGAKITKTQYRGSQSIDLSTSGKLTLIFSSEYASQAGCYMLLSNFNTEPLLIELGRTDIGQFNVTATHKSQNVDTITVTTAGDEYSWYVLQL